MSHTPHQTYSPMTNPDRLPLTSLDLAEDRKALLRKSFPEVFREDRIDFDALQRALGEWVDPGKERFGLNWPGKAACSKLIQQASVGTLLPMREQSVDFDSTENLIIEGDNLEVLKLLQKSYYGKVKTIYIDPPYNTGNEFIYPDNFKDSLRSYQEYSGQIDAEGRKQSSNTETGGRYHSNWLSMMYPRLFLARNLLREDGMIFVSIDDHEVHNLRALMNEIFGEENLFAEMVWKNKTGGGAKTKGWIGLHEYIICYAKNISEIADVSITYSEKTAAMYNKKDENFAIRGPYATWPLDTTSMGDRPNLRFPIFHNHVEILPEKQWLWSQERVLQAQKLNMLEFNKQVNGEYKVRFKGYLRDENGVVRRGKPLSILDGPYTQDGSRDFQELLPKSVFPFPKPVQLMRQILSISTSDGKDNEYCVLDFFAGSGSLAQAVMSLNNEDGGSRKFILVQLPEPTDNPTYPTIADITRERVRRVSAKLKTAQAAPDLLSDASNNAAPDLGFKAMRLASSNFKVWDRRADQMTDVGATLQMFAEHVLPGRTAEDILHELLLKTGYPLTTPLTTLTLAGKQVFSASEGALLICLERELSLDVIEAMVARDPWLILCLDAGFAGQDELKANAMQTVRAHNRNRQSSMSLKVV